jgi:N-acetylglutamate synthase-like GNAT family acetyltransferase
VREPADAPRAAVTIRQARLADAPRIAALIALGQTDEFLLPRPEADVRAAWRRFVVATSPPTRRDPRGRVLATASLEPYGPHLAEIRSLVVDPRHRGAGIGHRLVRALQRRARRGGATRVFALTMRPRFFERLGFMPVPLENFPEKVFRDCARCPRRAACVEVAVEWRADR